MLYITAFTQPDHTIKQIYTNCYVKPDFVTWFRFYSDYLMNDVHLLDIINALSILYIKSTDDILQGISKLDHLLKVSVFQKYIEEHLRTSFTPNETVGYSEDTSINWDARSSTLMRP
jgi:hypothetical protein